MYCVEHVVHFCHARSLLRISLNVFFMPSTSILTYARFKFKHHSHCEFYGTKKLEMTNAVASMCGVFFKCAPNMMECIYVVDMLASKILDDYQQCFLFVIRTWWKLYAQRKFLICMLKHSGAMHTRYFFVTVCIILMTFHKHNDIFFHINQNQKYARVLTASLCFRLLLTSVAFQQFEGSCDKKQLTNSNSFPFFWSGAIKVPYPF